MMTCLYNHRYMSSSPLITSLQRKETIKEASLWKGRRPTENYNHSKCRAVELSPKGSIYKPYHTLRLWELCSKGKQKDCKSQEIREIVVRLCLIVKSEVPPIKALTLTAQTWAKQGNSNKHTKVDVSRLRRPPPTHLKNVESGRKSLSQEQAHQLLIQYQTVKNHTCR